MTRPPDHDSGADRGRHLAPNRRRLGDRFRILYLGAATSLLATYIAYLTIPLVVLDLVNEARMTMPFSIAYALETVPTLAFGLLGGVILDRVRLRAALIVANFVRAAAFFYLASSIGTLGLGQLFAIAFLVGSFSAVYENALFAIIPALVPEQNLARANGRIASTQAAMFASGPMLAGALASLGGTAPALWMNGILFVVSALILYSLGYVERMAPPQEEERAGFVEETLNGIRFLVGERRLLDSTIAAAAANLVFGFIEGTFVVMATVVLGARTEIQIGVLIVAFGLGSIVGASGADRVIRIHGLGRTMTIGVATMAAGMGTLVFSTFGPMALVFAFFMFVGIGLVNVPIATIRQVYTPPAMLGRVITASRALSWGTLPIGALLGGALADNLDYTTIVRATPVLLIVVAVWLVTTPLWKDSFGPTHRKVRRRALPQSEGASDGEDSYLASGNDPDRRRGDTNS